MRSFLIALPFALLTGWLAGDLPDSLSRVFEVRRPASLIKAGCGTDPNGTPLPCPPRPLSTSAPSGG